MYMHLFQFVSHCFKKEAKDPPPDTVMQQLCYFFGLVDQAALFFTVAEKHVQDEQVGGRWAF